MIVFIEICYSTWDLIKSTKRRPCGVFPYKEKERKIKKELIFIHFFFRQNVDSVFPPGGTYSGGILKNFGMALRFLDLSIFVK